MQCRDISHMTQMLNEMRKQAEERDKTLAYFIEMAAVHSADIDMGRVKPEPLNKPVPQKDYDLETVGIVAA
jgi:hypothetical protein